MTTSPPILIVDDDPDIREILVHILKADRRSVLTANNGAEAVKIVETGDPIGLILLDLMMPGMDGIAVISALKSGPYSHVPVVIMSGQAGVKETAQRMEVADYLTKPIELRDLLRVVASLTRRSAPRTIPPH